MNSLKIFITILLSIAFSAFIFFAVRYVFYKMIDKRIANYQNDLLTKQYNEVENIYKKIRAWRHDYHNHIQTMNAYLELGRFDDMKSYLNNLDKDLTSIDTVLKNRQCYGGCYFKESKAVNQKPEYSTFQNTVYLIKNIWEWDKILFLLCFLQIPAAVIIPLLGIYIPKILIDSAVRHVSSADMFINAGLPILAIIFLNLILNTSASITHWRGISYRMKYLQLLSDKTIDTDFENIDGPEGEEKREKAHMATRSNSSAMEAIIKTVVELFSNILGFILYAGMIFTVHPLILAFLFLS